MFQVRYNVNNWLEKNKDPLNDTAVAVMKTSKGNALLQTIWADYTTQEEAAKKAKGYLQYNYVQFIWVTGTLMMATFIVELHFQCILSKITQLSRRKYLHF